MWRGCYKSVGKSRPLTNGAGRFVLPLEKNNLDPYLKPYRKINSKQIKDLNVKNILHLKLSFDIIKEYPYDPGVGWNFLSQKRKTFYYTKSRT